EGPAVVTSADISGDGDVAILDKTIPLASLDKDGVLEAEMIVGNNRGYVTADRNFDESLGVDWIPLDSSHSPILRVNYRVEPARVGKRIDYESLTLEVWTTGAISPVEAVARAAKVMRDHLVIFLDVVDEPTEKEPASSKRDIPFLQQADVLAKPIEHLELSVRSNNCLRSAGIEKIYELVRKTEDELLKTKNFGRKSLGEIKETLANLGLGLNLDLHAKLLERLRGEGREAAKETDA
ncbi:MAG: DNA-directed RNA polymerase subunit alpha, partial [Candidatus Aminicenantes bacterium]|nr:DNA-directed RNA polymerase subunit alpha [Candidatus Aminicenantes bacterium]